MRQHMLTEGEFYANLQAIRERAADELDGADPEWSLADLAAFEAEGLMLADLEGDAGDEYAS
jgi:hypothetical protein